MDILAPVLAQLLIPIIFIGGIIWLVVKFGGKSRSPAVLPDYEIQRQLNVRDGIWLEYIAAHQKRAKTKAEKALLQTLLDENNYHQTNSVPIVSILDDRPAVVVAESTYQPAVSSPALPTTPKEKIDSTLLLLYFGAFLFVASTGLFVAFAGLDGIIRTLLVIFVMLVMYFGGLWLHRQQRLRQAGVTFVAIGMAIAPLIGPALFNFVTGQTNAPSVWLITSLLCISLYIYALFKIRSSFIGYLVIFSFLSLFESGVSIVNLPIYYLVWGMLVAGMIVRAMSLIFKFWPELREPGDMSVRFVVPLTIFVSLALVGQQGLYQLAVSLLLATAYYLLEGFSGDKSARPANLLGAHICFLLGSGVAAYAVGKNVQDVALIFMGLSALHLFAILLLPKAYEESHNVATVSMIAVVAAGIFGYSSPLTVLAAAIGAILLGLVTAFHQHREEGAVFAASSLIALPYIVGQVVSEQRFSAANQSYASVVVALTLLGCYIATIKSKQYADWRMNMLTMFVVACSAAIIPAFFAGRWVALGVCAAIAGSFILNELAERSREWAVSSGIIVLLPVMYGIVLYDQGFFLAAVLVALAWNIIISLVYRQETNRWFGAILWLILPLSFGLGALGFKFSATGFAWAYIASMLGLILSRAIARGVVFASSRVPITSFARNSSLSYSVGYTTAAVMAVIFSLASSNLRLHTSLILGTLFLTTLLLARVVEKRSDLYALLPILGQLIIITALHPVNRFASTGLYPMIIASCVLACLGYLLTAESDFEHKAGRFIRDSSLAMSYVAPVIYLFTGEHIWLLPLSLIVAGALTLERFHDSTQLNREISASVMVIGLMWLVYDLGGTNIQIHTHILAAMFGAFAYWRYLVKDESGTNGYLYAMFFTASVPLLLQALGGVAGDLYGWWLLLEEVMFMLLGITINRRFLTTWGLYTAVAAVLYQLRHLGWAALLVLAVFIICIALRRLAKLNKKNL